VQPVAWIPSPSQSVWHLGPLPIRAYALCIVAGIIVALIVAGRRFEARGGRREQVWDIAGWAIVFGIIGGRLYHIVTDPELYFGSGEHPLDAFKIWDGGLGIWGAIALGALGAWIGCRRKGVSLPVFADAAVPGVALAQAIGRWGNWFNNELYGGPTGMPWGLQIHCLSVTVGHAEPGGIASGGERCPVGSGVLTAHYQPTFLYECLWDIGIALLLIYLDRRHRMGRGTVFALYVMAYTAGRGWIEALRTDHANHVLGLRLNDWTSILLFLIALVIFLRRGGFRSQREPHPYRRPPDGDPAESRHVSGDAQEEVTADGRHDQ
jgi:prolipoprotein diacylglyceryl transferase